MDQGTVIKELQENTQAGFLSRVLYDKQDRTPPIWRVVVPIRLEDGVIGLNVRVIQLRPELGSKAFRVDRIVDVKRDVEQLSPEQIRRSKILTGEVFSVASKAPAHHNTSPMVDQGASTRSVWSQAWFLQYSGAVRNAVIDLQLLDDEREMLAQLARSLRITDHQIAAAHAYIIGEELLALSLDGQITQADRERVRQLNALLSSLGSEVL